MLPIGLKDSAASESQLNKMKEVYVSCVEKASNEIKTCNKIAVATVGLASAAMIAASNLNMPIATTCVAGGAVLGLGGLYLQQKYSTCKKQLSLLNKKNTAIKIEQFRRKMSIEEQNVVKE